MAVMADGSFPFGAVGLVHVENQIVQHRPHRPRRGADDQGQADETAAPPEGPHLQPADQGQVRRPRSSGRATSTMLRRGGGNGDSEPQQDRRAASDERRAGRERRVEARRRPGAALRGRLRRPQPDPHARAGRRSRSASRGRSRTGCGPRRAAWRRSRAACPTPSQVDVRFRKPILLPGPGRVRQQLAGTTRSHSRCATQSAAHRTSTAASRRSRPNPKTGGSRDAHRHRRQGRGRAQHGPRPALAQQAGRLGPARPHPHPQAGRAGAVHRHQERLPLGDRRRAHLQGGPEPDRAGTAEAEQAAGLFDVTPDDEQQMLQEGGARLRRGEGAARSPSRPTSTSRRRASCSTRPTSSASTCSASPRSSAASCTSRPR